MSSDPQAGDDPRGFRLNLKFVIPLVLVLLALAGGAVGWRKVMADRRQKQLVEWADTQMAQGNYDEAAQNYGLAIAHRPQDTDLDDRWGDALYQLSSTRPEAVQQARSAWEMALHANPERVSTLKRLLAFHAQACETAPTESTFNDLGEVANTLARLAPDDARANTLKHVAVIGRWMYAPHSANHAAPAAPEQDIAALTQALDQNPADADALYYLGAATIRQAMELRTAGKNAQADQLVAKYQQHVEAAAAAQQANQESLFRAACGFVLLAQASGSRADIAVSPDSSDSESTAPKPAAPATQPASGGAAVALLKRARATADRAAQISQAKDPRFVSIRLLDGELAEAIGDHSAAEAIYRDVLKQRGDAVQSRIRLARLLAATHRDKAIEVLQIPDDLPPSDPGPCALLRKPMRTQALYLRAALCIQNIADSKDPQAQQAALGIAKDAVEKAKSASGETPGALTLLARLQLLEGRNIETVQTADKAIDLATHHGLTIDPELPYLKAAAFWGLREPQLALQALHAALDADGSLVADRLLQAQIFLSQGQVDDAAGQADLLRQQVGSDPRVIHLLLAVLRAQNSAQPSDDRGAQMKKLYALLPETDNGQRFEKSHEAVALNDLPDAERLLRANVSADPSSAVDPLELARVLATLKQKDQAQTVVAEALKKHPADGRLLYLRRELDGATPDELKQYAQSLDNQQSDPLSREIHAAQEALSRSDLASARQSLDKAAVLNSTDPRLLELQFRVELIDHHWDAAQQLQGKLAGIDRDQMKGLSFAFDLEIAHGDLSAAMQTARDMTRRYEQFCTSWLALGHALEAAGHSTAAIDPFSRAVSLSPTNIEALKGLARCQLSAGKSGDALQSIASGRRLAPQDPELRELELQQELSSGDPARLLPSLESAAQGPSASAQDVLALARVELAVSGNQASANPDASRESLNRGRQALDRMMKQWPDDQRGYVFAADAASRAGEFQAGEKILHELASRPAWAGKPEPLLALADYHERWGRLDLAEVDLRAASQLQPGVTLAMRLAEVQREQGNWKASLDTLLPWIKEPRARTMRVNVLLSAGQLQQAQAEVTSALSADPKSSDLMALLGVVCAARQNYSEATSSLNAAIAADPDNALARRTRGAVRLQHGDGNIDGAVDDLTAAHRAAPEDAQTTLLLAGAYSRAHDNAHAQDLLREALQLSPQNKPIRLGLIDLYNQESPPRWDAMQKLIAEGRAISSAEPDWDAAEARMWLERKDPVQAAGLMRHAVALCWAKAPVAGISPSLAGQPLAADRPLGHELRGLIREQLSMRLQTHDGPATRKDADYILQRFGPDDTASAWAHLTRGLSFLNDDHNPGQAGPEFDAALNCGQASNDVPACIELMQVLANSANPDEALHRMAAARPELAGDPRWSLLKVTLLDQKADLPAAARAADELMPSLTSLPADQQLTLLRLTADAHWRIGGPGEVEKARDAYIALLDRSPDDLAALNNLSYLLLEQITPPNPQQALVYSRHAYEVMTRGGGFEPRVADTHGWALVRAGELREGIELLQRVVEQLSSPDTQDHLGEAYLLAGQPREAQAHLAAAIELLNQATQKGEPVDPALRLRIEAAQRKAMELKPTT